jgi:hypothetical protein
MSKEVIVSAPSTELTVGGLPNTIEQSDIDIPRINVVQKTSDINLNDGEPAPYGSIVLDKRFLMSQPEEEIKVVPLLAVKQWREDIPFDSDEVPRIAGSIEERNKLAADSDYDLLEFAEITFLFEGSDDVEAFPLPLGKKNYAIGRINVAKDAYRQTFKRLATFAMYNKKTPVHTRVWNLKSTLITRGKYSWFAPSLSITPDDTSKDVATFVEDFVS